MTGYSVVINQKVGQLFILEISFSCGSHRDSNPPTVWPRVPAQSTQKIGSPGIPAIDVIDM